MKIPWTPIFVSLAVVAILINPDAATWSKCLATGIASFIWGTEFGSSRWVRDLREGKQ